MPEHLRGQVVPGSPTYQALLRQDAAVAERCAVIDAEKANYKLAWMCRLLGVPRSSFCAWRNKAETATAARRRELAGQVRRVIGVGRGAYGCRRVAAQLNREGHACSVGLVADLMRGPSLCRFTTAGPRA